MSDDLTLDAVDAIAAAKCAEIEARRVLARLSPEDQRRLRHDFGFMGRAGTFTLPGTMTFKEAREAADIEQVRVTKEEVAKAFNISSRAFTPPGTMPFGEIREAVHCGETFPSGKTRGQEVAENLAETFAFTMKNPHVDRVAVLAQIIDAERAAAVNDERERIRRRTAHYATIESSELDQILRP